MVGVLLCGGVVRIHLCGGGGGGMRVCDVCMRVRYVVCVCDM